MMNEKKLKWRKTYGDGEYTEDYVLWNGNEPTEYIICESTYGGWWVMKGRTELSCWDYLKTAKNELLKYLKENNELA